MTADNSRRLRLGHPAPVRAAAPAPARRALPALRSRARQELHPAVRTAVPMPSTEPVAGSTPGVGAGRRLSVTPSPTASTSSATRTRWPTTVESFDHRDGCYRRPVTSADIEQAADLAEAWTGGPVTCTGGRSRSSIASRRPGDTCPPCERVWRLALGRQSAPERAQSTASPTRRPQRPPRKSS